MTRDDVGKWIKAAREARGWTQSDLGDRLGLTKANISHWETGKHDPSFLQLLKIRDLTGHQLLDVMPAHEWPLPQVRREQLTSLNDDQLKSVQLGLVGILAALTAPIDQSRKQEPKAA